MKIRAITSEELEQFAKLSDHPTPESVRSIKELATKLWTRGDSRPEWFFLSEQDGQPVGRVAYWRLNARPEELRMITLKLPWESGFLDVGLQLLLESWERLKTSSAQYIMRQLVSTWDYLSEQQELLEHAGMKLLQEKQSYIWNPGDPVVVPSRLTYRTVEQAGEAAFIDAIHRVTVGVTDREIQAMGGEDAAKQLFMILKEDNMFNPNWAQLAYNPHGELVGLVAPVGIIDSEDEGSIGYIGVTPEKRGQGHIHDLLAKGMAVLQEVGMHTVYSDTDIENSVIRRAFERLGHRPYCQVWLYRRSL